MIESINQKRYKKELAFYSLLTSLDIEGQTSPILKIVLKIISHRFGVINRYRRKRPKVDAIIFDSALSHTRRSEASKKKEESSVSTFGRSRLWASFKSSPVSFNQNLF